MAEKRRPTYDLESFRAWARTSDFRTTGTALRSAVILGFGSRDMTAVIQSMQKRHFYKSMTSHTDHREWQDVYHVPSEAGVLYVKFRADVVTEFLSLSFKEKDNG